MKRNIILITISILLGQTSCASLNKAHGELHYNNNVTKGQELLDLKKALDEGAINQKEFELMKEKIIKDEYVKSFFKQLDEMDDEDDKKTSI